MNDSFFLGLDFDADSTEPINFIETRLHDLSPFSAHEVEIDDVVYKTAEHAYQTLRMTPEAAAEIMAATCPKDAWRVAQGYKEKGCLRDDYDKDALMEQIFRAKLGQHLDVEKALLATNSRELRKVHDADYYWGTGHDGSGENKMGKLWMKLRAELT